jgi:hypothetical protein
VQRPGREIASLRGWLPCRSLLLDPLDSRVEPLRGTAGPGSSPTVWPLGQEAPLEDGGTSAGSARAATGDAGSRACLTMRSPDRPNSLGLHPVTVRAIEARPVRICPIEAIDGTPVVDIKPVLR